MVLFIHLYGNDFCKSVKTKYLRQKEKIDGATYHHNARKPKSQAQLPHCQ